MKKTIIALSLLLPTIACAAQPTTIGFRNISAAGVTNQATTCSVLQGKQFADGTFNIVGSVSYAMTKGGTASFTPTSGADYKISCWSTSVPATAVVVKMFFNASETYNFPISTLLYRHN